MLSFLLPRASSIQASSQAYRRIQAALGSQGGVVRQHAWISNSVGPISHTIRIDDSTDDLDDRIRRLSHKSEGESFSHFFDKRTPLDELPEATASGKSKASHEIAAASRQATATFRQAIGTRVPAKIIEAYAHLIQAHQRHAQDVSNSSSRPVQNTDIGFPVRKADIQTAIRYLVQHAQKEGHMASSVAEECHQMFEDMSQRFGFRIGPTDLHRQLQTYCLCKSTRFDPCAAFQRLRASYPDWQTTSIEWNMVISYLVQQRSYGHAVKTWQEMLECGVKPDTSLRNTMIRVHLAVNNTAEAETQLDHLAKENEHLGIDTLTTTVEGLCKLIASVKQTDEGVMSKLRAYASDLRKEVGSYPQAAVDLSAWHALLRYEALIASPTHALETARQARKPGLFRLRTLCMLLRLHVDELADLQSSDDALELLDRIQVAIDPDRSIQPNDQCYNILMLGLLNNAGPDSAFGSEDAVSMDADAKLFAKEVGDTGSGRQLQSLPTPNQIREAQFLYDHIRTTGIPPTPLLVTPLLTAYCEAFLPSIPSAMKLVQDLLDHRPSSVPPTRKAASSSQQKGAPSFIIGMKIIQPVLDACVRLADISSARELLSRLYNAGVVIAAQDKVILMRRLLGITNSWSEAFHIYRSLSRFPTHSSSGARKFHSRGLDERGYIALLESMRSLQFSEPKPTPASHSGGSLPAPPDELLSILEDMRSAGYRPSCAIYTSILDYYAKAPQPSYLGVRATHEMLKRDEGLEPDLALINALMNAYNRADEPAMVLAIWNSLLATRQEIDGVTLSVFFDTAGRHGLLALARKAISTIRRIEAESGSEQIGGYRRSAMSKGAWDSWLECLARCGRLEEAIELAFGEMRKTLLRTALDADDLLPCSTSDGVVSLTVSDLVVKSSQAPIRNKEGQVVGPDAKTMGTLLKFAARERDRRQKRAWASSEMPSSYPVAASGTSIWHTLRARIREELSWLYPQIKHIGDTRTQL